MASKLPSASRVEMTQLVLPSETNSLGTAFGGKIMQWVDMAAGVAARRHAGCIAVTLSMDSLRFSRPVNLGDVVVLRASVNRAWHSSMEVGVRVDCEPLKGDGAYQAAHAYLTFVAVDEQGRSRSVPLIEPTTVDEKRRYEQASQRRAQRLLKRDSPDSRSERQAELSQAVGGVVARLAHDINNPLSAVVANLRFLEGETDQSELKEAIQESAVSAERVAHMIDVAGTLAALRAGRLEPKRQQVAVQELRQSAQRHLGLRLGSRRIEWDVDVTTIVIDQALLTRALLAVLDHCVSRAPPGDTIRVEMVGDGGLTLCISDGGPPFAQDHVPSIVAEEIPVDSRRDSGSRSDEGLGLHFAGVAARAMGATVTVRTDERDGQQRVVFQMSFPEHTTNHGA